MKWITLAAIFVALIGCIQNPPMPETPTVAVAPPQRVEPSTPKPSTDTGYAQRFNDVARIFIDKGASVDPLDPSAPYTMRVYLPSSLAMNMTQVQARELAGMARTRLHDKAIVYIKTEGGQTIAKATPWGFE